MGVHLFGIRHHGPGSARSLVEALEVLKPDCILVEGPPEADGLLALAGHADMRPPVALLIYQADAPQRAAYYPLAEFSPEWQAIGYGLSRGVPVRFMDLPPTHMFAMHPAGANSEPSVDVPEEEPGQSAHAPEEEPGRSAGADPFETAGADPSSAAETGTTVSDRPPSPEGEDVSVPGEGEAPHPREDPLGWLARAAGYSDGERWWEHMVEQRRDSNDLFQGIAEMMGALREAFPKEDDRIEALREAHMRRTIRAAVKEGFARIAVVCGAWHVPALTAMPSEKADSALLKGLPRVKVGATWTPWTNGRLTYHSGYGAGIGSPGWYGHLWAAGRDRLSTSASSIRWMTRVARLLRDEDLDASPSQVIEAVRLAESLAALRGHPLPGLDELNEASLTVFCFGNDLPMRLIDEKLVVGEALGSVPEATPMAPLQADLARERRRLRLPEEASERALDLDLRKPTDLERSHLLHRLNLLGIPWGREERVSGKSGTFHEVWRLRWDPLFAVSLIEVGVWGNTIGAAAEAKVRGETDRVTDLPSLTGLLDAAILASLPDAVDHVMERLGVEAAVASDVGHLMDALPPLAGIARYGNVRGTDPRMVGGVIDGLVARICVGLPGACASLNDEAADAMFDRLMKVNGAILLLQRDDYRGEWHGVLLRMAGMEGLHGRIAGRCCRLLLDGGAFDGDEAARRMGLELSRAVEPARSAAWTDGFVTGSGLLLLHDDALWAVVDGWVTGLNAEMFQELLPLLRRTFSTFERHERRQMGERLNRGLARPSMAAVPSSEFDRERAEAVLPLVAQLFGITSPGAGRDEIVHDTSS